MQTQSGISLMLHPIVATKYVTSTVTFHLFYFVSILLLVTGGSSVFKLLVSNDIYYLILYNLLLGNTDLNVKDKLL